MNRPNHASQRLSMNHTIIQRIEDDLKSVAERKLPEEEFLRRLLEQFVFVAVSDSSEKNILEIVLLAGQGDEGMFLPVFTSPERFLSTPLAKKHELKKLPFDVLMRQIRPDTGLVVNPFNPVSHTVRWFVLQEHVPDFGSEAIKQEVTPPWLESVNAEFSKQEMPHRRRPWEAIRVWNEVNGVPISGSSIRARQIFDWFHVNTKPGSHMAGPLAEAAFYHDGAFWEVTIPLGYGSPSVDFLDMLRMPASVKLRFWNERNDLFIFVKFFADCFDYFYSVDDLRSSFASNPLLKGFIAAGREHITQAASLLLDTRPNAKAAEASRFALEIFLKTFLVAKGGLSEKEIKDLRHDLQKLLTRCLEVDPQSELRHIESKLSLYPDVAARYRAEDMCPRDLWATYYTALTSGAVVMRPLSGRDTTKSIQIPPF
jgi:HEPN domain-containing protein